MPPSHPQVPPQSQPREALEARLAAATPPRWWNFYDRYVHWVAYDYRDIPVVVSVVFNLFLIACWYVAVVATTGEVALGKPVDRDAILIGRLVLLCWAAIPAFFGPCGNPTAWVRFAHGVRALVPGARLWTYLLERLIEPLEKEGRWRDRRYREELARQIDELKPPPASGSTVGL